MLQNKTEYAKVKEKKVRCGKYRYLTTVKRIIAFEKLINKNRADVKLSSFVHNFRRFTSEKYLKPTIHDEKYYSEKKQRLRTRAERALMKCKIHIFTPENLTINNDEEKEINALMARMNFPIHNATDTTTSKSRKDDAKLNNTEPTTAEWRE